EWREDKYDDEIDNQVMKKADEIAPDQRVDKDRVVELDLPDKIGAIDEHRARFRHHRRDQHPDHKARCQKWQIDFGGLIPEADTDHAERAGEKSEIDDAPTGPEYRPAISPLDVEP